MVDPRVKKTFKSRHTQKLYVVERIEHEGTRKEIVHFTDENLTSMQRPGNLFWVDVELVEDNIDAQRRKEVVG